MVRQSKRLAEEMAATAAQIAQQAPKRRIVATEKVTLRAGVPLEVEVILSKGKVSNVKIKEVSVTLTYDDEDGKEVTSFHKVTK